MESELWGIFHQVVFCYKQPSPVLLFFQDCSSTKMVTAVTYGAGKQHRVYSGKESLYSCSLSLWEFPRAQIGLPGSLLAIKQTHI